MKLNAILKLLGTKHKFDVVITEIGGTVGDIESLPYVEAVRQLKWELGNRALVIHLTLVPYLNASGELKTKPTQHSVKTLLEAGVQPDVLVLRTEKDLGPDIRKKVALFCNVNPKAVIQSIDVSTIYEVPVKMQEEGLDEICLEKLELPVSKKPDLKKWKSFLAKMNSAEEKVTIGLVGKYVELADAYKSIIEALNHAATYHDRKADIKLIHSEGITADNAAEQLKGLDAVLVAPGLEAGVLMESWKLCDMLVKIIWYSWVFVWVCNVPLLSLPEMLFNSKKPTQQKWIILHHIL